MIRRYLLDTGIAQDFQADRRGVRARADSERRLGHRIGIRTPVLGELWAGVKAAPAVQKICSVFAMRYPVCLFGPTVLKPLKNSAGSSQS